MAAWGGFVDAEQVEAAARARAQPADLVAADATGVVGFVAWDENTGEITRLYTHPRAWGRGVATELLDHALDALRAGGRSLAWLYTEERNERGRRFYEGRGWRIEGPPREREWQGARLREARYVKDL